MRLRDFTILVVLLCVSSACLGAVEAIPAEEPGPFSGGIADAVWTIIAFLLLLASLWKLAWNPMLTGLKTRQEYIQKQITDAEHVRKEAQQVLAEYGRKLEGYEQDGKRIINEHVKRAEQEAARVLAEAKDKTEQIRQKAQTEIARFRSDAEDEMMSQAGEIVLRLGQELLGRSVTSQDNQRLIEEAINRLRQESRQGKGS